MTSSFQGGTFQPIESGDVTDNLRQSFAFSNQGMERIDAMNRQNQAALLKGAGKQFEQLAELSPTVGKFLGMKWQERRNAKKAQLHTWYMINKGQGLEEGLNNYKTAKDGMREEYKGMSAIVDNDENMPFYLKKRFKDMSRWERNVLDEIALKDAATTYNPSFDPQIQNAITREEYEAGLAAYTQKFYEQFGDLDPAMVYENVTKHVLEARTNSLNKWHKKREKEYNEVQQGQAEDNATLGFKSGIPLSKQKVGEGQTASVGTVVADWNAKMLGLNGGNKAKTRDDLENHLKGLIQSGGGSYDSIKALGEEVWEGYKIKDHPQYSHIIKNLQKEQWKYENSWWKTRVDSLKNTARQALVNAKSSVLNNEVPDNELDEYLGKAIVQVEQAGGDATDLKRMKDNLVKVDGKSLGEWKRLADEYANDGLYTTYQHNRMPVQIRRMPYYQQIAEKQTVKREDLTIALKAIDSDVKKAVNKKMMIRQGSDSDKLIRDMQARVATLGREYDIKGVDNPYEVARQDVMKWFDEHRKTNFKGGNFLSAKGIRFETYREKGIAPSSNEHNLFLQEMDNLYNILQDSEEVLTFKVLNEDGTAADHTPWFHRTELEKLKKGIGKPGWIPDARVRYLMRKTGKDYATIINEQLKTLDREELPPSPALNVFSSLNDASKSLLNSSQTEEQDARGLGTFYVDLGETVDGVSWNPAITYEGLAPQVWEVSQLEGQPPHKISAMIELINIVPDINVDKKTGRLTSPTLLDADLYATLARFEWKHSGGTDVFSLRTLEKQGIR